MQELFTRLLAAFLSALTLLVNPLADIWNLIQKENTVPPEPVFVAFEDWSYTRPDIEAYEELVDRCLEAADSSRDLDELLELMNQLNDQFDSFVTNCNLANIYYNLDVTDEYWLEEYNFCTENTTTVEAGLDDVLYALADNPLKEELEEDPLFGEDFFDDYMGDSIWDDTFTALSQRENDLMTKYNDLTAAAGDMDPYSDEYFETYGKEIAEIFVQLVDARQDIAEYLGYDNYLDYAYAEVYYRDYTPEDATKLIDDISRELPDLYWSMDDSVYNALYKSWSKKKTHGYVEEGAEAMGGIIWEAFQVMEEGGFYDIDKSANKYDASYMIYMPDYSMPFIFMNAQGNAQDPLTFTHEFGHFCNNYASMGSNASIDVAEIFSQALEYLSLSYCEDTEALAKLHMATALETFMFQAYLADFENQVYLMDKRDLTVENIKTLYEETALKYDMAMPGRNFVNIPHFFIAPVYVISYVTSADAALQIFQLEEAKKGAGLELYMDNLDTEEVEFLAFLDSAGLDSPFRRGRAAEIRETMEKYLG